MHFTFSEEKVMHSNDTSYIPLTYFHWLNHCPVSYDCFVTVALAYTFSHGAKAQANQGYEMTSFLKNTNQS